MDNKAIGLQIRQGRLAKGETQAFMGAKLGISQQAVCGFENGRRTVPQRHHKRLVREYGVVLLKPDKDEKPERCATHDRRQSDITPIEQQFIGELRGLLEAVKGMLFSGVRVRRGRIVRRARA
jgi:transcriptional regulator with XRE-family HTH domain